MIINPAIFKAYDIRGIYPLDFNEKAAYAITQAFIKLYQPKKVVLGRDVRESGESLFNSSLLAFLNAGVNVIDIGVISSNNPILMFSILKYGKVLYTTENRLVDTLRLYAWKLVAESKSFRDHSFFILKNRIASLN